MEAVNEYRHGHDDAGSGASESGVTGRLDRDVRVLPRIGGGSWVNLAVLGLALGFVAMGASSLDLGPEEADWAWPPASNSDRWARSSVTGPPISGRPG